MAFQPNEPVHLYLVSYDITEPGRWRRAFRLLKRVGRRLQLSVFSCRATPRSMARVEVLLSRIIDEAADRTLIADLGPLEGGLTRVRAHNPLSGLGDLEALVV